MNPVRDFFDTLAFMTRLGPARVIPTEAMGRAMVHLPLVGLVLGLAAALPFWIGLFGHSPWTQAWCAVVLSALLTRGLHLDGLADVFDAQAAHMEPDRFWTILKDSRMGAFGATALVLALGGQILFFHEMFAAGKIGAVVWTFVLGRGASVALAARVRDLARPGLGKLYMDGATTGTALWAVAFTAVSGLFLAGVWPTVAGVLLASLAALSLYRLAFRVGGANGDFLGAAVVLGELCAGLGFVLTL